MAESELFKKLAILETEQNNPRTKDIDIVSVRDALLMLNDEDILVAKAVRNEIDDIEEAVNIVTECFLSGGRLFYVGAGTSGRLGILDASEIPPTFGAENDLVQGIIAGGKEAVFRSQEGAEDSFDNGAKELAERSIYPPDVVCGIAASGRTPFVLGALNEAKNRNCKTILITTVSKETAISNGASSDVMICPNVGPEAIAGSTRLKSGTAQKLVLNMLTTASMVQIGKTYGNIMLDLKPTNDKLKERAKRIVMSIANVPYNIAEDILIKTNWQVKTAIVMLIGNLEMKDAIAEINKAQGKARIALEKTRPLFVRGEIED